MTPTTQQRIELEIIGMVCRFSANVFIALFIVGLMFVYVISLDHSQLTAWTWYAVLVAIAVIRWKYQAQFLRRPRDADAIGRWRAFLIVGSAVTGFAWSIPSSFLLPASLETQLFVCASLIGVVAAASGVLSPLRSAFFWFLVGTLGPAVATQFLQGGMHLFFGAGILLFMAASFAVALRHNTDVHRMLALAFENEQLAARLVEENQLAAKANERLQEEIAERTRAERSLQIAKSEADQANRAKSQFLANMSHELRTPLNAIMGTTELLCRTTLDDKQSKYARTTYRASERLLGIINDILDLARIEAGHLRVKQSVFEPRKWLSEIVELFAPQAAEKSLMITQRVDQDVPLQIEADSERLRQVLTNLIGNAIKFTLEGGIAVTLSKVIAGDKVRLRCEVRDTGIGIASDEQTRLFQPFSQVENSAARRFGGAGLGLAISRQLIEAMHGELGLESHLGQGSMFWFSVPVGAIDTASNNESQIGARAVPELSARVLVVEDTEHNRELIVDMLTLAGCTVHAVISGAEALQVLRTEKFDAVIMDWHMPELDGLQAIRLLRERERVAKVVKPLRIIALTGSAMPGDRETCLAAGADDYLSKPFTLDALLTVVGKQTR